MSLMGTIGKAIFLIIIISAVFSGNLQGADITRIDNDPSVLEVLNRLELPSERHSISDAVFKPADTVRDSRLSFVASWEENSSMIELYKGEYNGYLAVLVSEDKIYCAQYVNDFYTDDIDFDHIDDYKFYFYEMEAIGDGIYVKTRAAYFLDGKGISLVYFDPLSSSPSMVFVNSTASLLPQM